jgi:hypothetical protein
VKYNTLRPHSSLGYRKRHANRPIDLLLKIATVDVVAAIYDSYGLLRVYAAVAAEGEREAFAQASGVTCLTCQLVIKGSLVSTSRR